MKELKERIEWITAYAIVYGIPAVVIAFWFTVVLRPMP